MCKFGDKSTNGQEKTISLGTSKGSVLELDHGKKLQKNYSVQKRNLGTLSKEKNDIIWEFFPNVGPPPPPPPFWEPLIQKNMKYAI